MMTKRIIAIVLAALSSVIIFEIFLKNTPFSHGASPVVYDAEIGMWHKPHYKGRKISACYDNFYSINSEGLVGTSVKYNDKLEDLVVIGDSYIEALMVKDESRITNRLALAYASKFNVLNYGLAGTSPIQHYVILEKKVNLSNTRAVVQFINVETDLRDVVTGTRTDISRPLVFLEFEAINSFQLVPPRGYDYKEWFRDKLSVLESYVYLKKVIYHVKKFIRNVGPNSNKNQVKRAPTAGSLNKNWIQLKGAIIATNNLLERKNIDYVVAFNSNEPENSKTIIDFLNQNNIQYFDVVSHLDSLNISYDSITYECDRHWNEKGHELIALKLHDVVLDKIANP